jgi:Anti-sigma factor NepR
VPSIHGTTSGTSVTPHEGWVVKDKAKMNEMSVPRSRRTEDGLGPNSDIGAKLRAFYGAVQDQPIPDKFLDLLEKLDEVEQAGKRKGR